MSASGPTSLPPGLRASESYAPHASVRPVDIVSVPPAREEERGRTRHLRGEILDRNDTGHVRIRTDRGDVHIKIDPRQTPSLEEGRRVDLEILPGDPPRQAFVKLLPAKVFDGPVFSGAAPGGTDRPPEPNPFYVPEDISGQETLPFLPSEGLVQDPEELTARLIFLPPARLLNQTQISSVPVFHSSLSAEAIFSTAGSASDSGVLPVIPPEPSLSPLFFHENFSAERGAQPRPSFPGSLSFRTPFLSTLQISDTPTAGGLVWFAPAVSEEEATLFRSASGLFLRLAEGRAFPDIEPITTAGQALSDPMAQRVPVQIDLRNLRIEGASIRIVGISDPSDNRIPSVLFQAPSGPEGILQGAAGTLGGKVVASLGPEGRPILALFLPESPFAHFFTLQTDGLSLSAGAGFDAFALKPPEGALSSLAVSSRPDIPAPLWPAMDDLFQTIAALDPQVGHVLARTIPNAAHPGLTGPAVLFFIAALRAGDMAGWVGEKAIDALRRAGKTELLNRLGKDFSSLSENAAREADEGGWKSLSLPFVWENRVQRATFHHRFGMEDDEGAQGDRKGAKSSRFVFDLAFNRLGHVQLDGLYRNSRLDIALRSVAPLSEAMQQILRARFAEGLAQAGIIGDIYFQSDPESFLKIPTREKPRSAWV